jgi:hypothetical protein
MARKKPTTKSAKQQKVHRVMSEFKEGQLRSGSKHGPPVTSRKQAVAIAMSESGQARSKRKKSVRGRK